MYKTTQSIDTVTQRNIEGPGYQNILHRSSETIRWLSDTGHSTFNRAALR